MDNLLDFSSLVCQLYKDNNAVNTIANHFSCSTDLVKSVLLSNGIEIEKRYGKKRKTKEEEKQICNDYLSGISRIAIADKFNISDDTIGRILKKHGIKTHLETKLKAKHQKAISPREQQAIDLYLQGLSTVKVGNIIGRSYNYVRAVLIKHNVKRRTTAETLKKLTDKQDLEIKDLYINQKMTMQEIAKIYNVSASTVAVVLRNLEVDISSIARYRYNFRSYDNMTTALSFTSRFSSLRPCYVYICQIKQHPQFVKIGITFDYLSRKDSNFGDSCFVSLFQSRHEAFFVEQAILIETHEYFKFPSSLIQWDGYSETRRISLEFACDILKKYQEQMRKLGPWKFAIEYLNLSNEQQQKCICMSEAKSIVHI